MKVSRDIIALVCVISTMIGIGGYCIQVESKRNVQVELLGGVEPSGSESAPIEG